MSSGLEMQLLDINNLGATEMMKAVESLEEAVKTEPAIESITSLYQGVVPQYRLDIDRDKVKLQGLSMSDIFSTLSAYMGGSYVNDFTEFGRVYQVTLKGDDSARGNIDDVLKLSVRNASGDMVPFTSFTTIAQSMGEPTASRYNMYPTASITANVAKGVSSSDGIKAMERLVHDTLGGNYAYSWTGQAYQEIFRRSVSLPECADLSPILPVRLSRFRSERITVKVLTFWNTSSLPEAHVRDCARSCCAPSSA